MNREKVLTDGAAVLGVDITSAQQDRLLRYLDLLSKWNRVYNLTAVRDAEAMIATHLLDSLSINQYLSGERILDVGSGAGLPGIPLAICNPARQFVLLDSNSKKTRFMQQAAIELELANVRVEQTRIENYHPAQRFDTVVSRAFASLESFVTAVGRLCAAQGHIVAMKGRLDDEELAALPPGFHEQLVQALVVPGVAAARSVVVISPASESAANLSTR